jgi:hypothetical protein
LLVSFYVNNGIEKKDKETVDKAEHIIRTVGRLIRAQVREMEQDFSYYPPADDLTSDMVPPLLNTFMALLVTDELKRNFWSHAIVQCARPLLRVMPLLLHKVFNLITNTNPRI